MEEAKAEQNNESSENTESSAQLSPEQAERLREILENMLASSNMQLQPIYLTAAEEGLVVNISNEDYILDFPDLSEEDQSWLAPIIQKQPNGTLTVVLGTNQQEVPNDSQQDVEQKSTAPSAEAADLLSTEGNKGANMSQFMASVTRIANHSSQLAKSLTTVKQEQCELQQGIIESLKETIKDLRNQLTECNKQNEFQRNLISKQLEELQALREQNQWLWEESWGIQECENNRFSSEGYSEKDQKWYNQEENWDSVSENDQEKDYKVQRPMLSRTAAHSKTGGTESGLYGQPSRINGTEYIDESENCHDDFSKGERLYNCRDIPFFNQSDNKEKYEDEAARSGGKEHIATSAMMAHPQRGRTLLKFCKNCREKGHSKGECRHKEKGMMRCLACGKLGTHRASNCPNSNNLPNSDEHFKGSRDERQGYSQKRKSEDDTTDGPSNKFKRPVVSYRREFYSSRSRGRGGRRSRPYRGGFSPTLGK